MQVCVELGHQCGEMARQLVTLDSEMDGRDMHEHDAQKTIFGACDACGRERHRA